ncbi:MAG: hypothetical protein QOH48_486 [Actinomycetota bacterium]|jgi:Family of unknown function (DUF5808)|nr:hypothetical protein [Actinomycetota bacterium]
MARPFGPSGILRVAAVGLAAIAIVREIRKSSSDREWKGTVGPVPYDFRIPTPKRIRERYWNPDDDRVLVPQLFGVGWTINVGRVVRLVRSRGGQ